MALLNSTLYNKIVDSVWKGAPLLGTVFIVFLALLAILVVLMLLMFIQYQRYRRMAPRPPYKQPSAMIHPRDFAEPLSVGWIGHSTLYIRWNGLGILTDPVFSERVGVRLPGWTIGPKRHTAPAMNLDDLKGHVDVILLSHAHLDHVDLPSLRRLASPDTIVVTAKGTSRLLRTMTFKQVVELDLQTSVNLFGMTVRAVPARHWGARFPWNRSYQWNGYLLEQQGVRLLFAGDTAYTSSYAELGGQGPVDVVCMPIGAYAPDSFQGSHCTPEQAWEMFQAVRGRYFVPIHWDTFVLSQEPVEEPLHRLLLAAGHRAGDIVIRRHGDIFTLTNMKTGTPSNDEQGVHS